MNGEDDGAPSPWLDAAAAASLFAVDPEGTGLVLRARVGPARDRFLALLRDLLPERRQRRLPPGIADGPLLGGLDLSATLRAGRPVAERGLLAEADGGLLVVPMAERLPALTASRIAAVLDSGEVRVERDGIALRVPSRFGALLLDEGAEDDERPPRALADRLALHVDLTPVSGREAFPAFAEAADLAGARARLPRIRTEDRLIEALCAASLSLGIASLRPAVQALAVARAAAALAGRDHVAEEDAALAARLVLGPRATRLPAAEPADEEEDPAPPDPQDAPPDPGEGGESLPDTLPDVVLEAALAAIPENLLARLRLGGADRRGEGAGRAGAERSTLARGRPAGVRRGALRAGARLNVVETLRAAAPWQPLRRREAEGRGEGGRRISVRPEDFRITRLKQRSRTTTIFLVDASGSAAFQRLAEAKGAVELLLAESYVRRDQVALIAFRGRGAELILPPTRSLVRAKRGLAGLPGGGGTPLAAGIDAGAVLAAAVKRRGETAVVVVLSDGRANVGRDGIVARDRATEEALSAARLFRATGTASLFLDTAPRPEPAAARLAAAMGALYLPLPRADAAAVSGAVRAAAPGAQERSAGR